MRRYFSMLKGEFRDYSFQTFTKDLMAGITVAAVALPLALAFGISSGATAASGLVTAVLAGILIAAFSGASFQISGPTGAMAAILTSLVAQHGLKGVFLAGAVSGLILLIAGLLKLGELVSFLPSSVITGFTSGIAIIIALGQVDNLTGLKSQGHETIDRIISYFTQLQSFHIPSLLIGVSVILLMIVYPKAWTKYCPSSLVAIVLATTANLIFRFDVPTVGAIPESIFLDQRLHISDITFESVKAVLLPAVSIAALGYIESLLCGSSASRMKKEKFYTNTELIGQGIGNLLIPFFGGIPATAAIARTSVGIRAGGATRLTSVIHALVLLSSMFLLGGIMSQIPLSALAGVLIMTAWRMNEWHSIRDIFKRRLKGAITQFLITMAVTVVFDLTIAILAGLGISILLFIIKVSDMQISVSDVESDRLKIDGLDIRRLKPVSVVYLSGPLYFGTANRLRQIMQEIPAHKHIVIFSMRGVSAADVSGIETFRESCEGLVSEGKMVYFSGVQPKVEDMMKRCGFMDRFKYNMFYWNTEQVFKQIAE